MSSLSMASTNKNETYSMFWLDMLPEDTNFLLVNSDGKRLGYDVEAKKVIKEISSGKCVICYEKTGDPLLTGDPKEKSLRFKNLKNGNYTLKIHSYVGGATYIKVKLITRIFKNNKLVKEENMDIGFNIVLKPNHSETFYLEYAVAKDEVTNHIAIFDKNKKKVHIYGNVENRVGNGKSTNKVIKE